ncbi:MAG TPA: DUF1343 domain-containing protein [Armatimonadota bacterium]|nr:DUF1343 domain-containing protein [Armatimonadota bacterium]
MAVRQESPEEAGFDGKRLERLAALLEQAVAAGETPGAVALVADRQSVVFHRAFGHAQVVPRAEPMRPDTLFDLASLTKVVATAPAILLLVEAGAIRLQDRVVEFIPEFAGEGKDEVDLRHLLTHCSGLPAWKPFYEQGASPEELFATICATPLEHPVGRFFRYSDIGFILLGEVVRRVSGLRLDEFTQRHLFAPLGMSETCFCPPASWAARCAATELRDGVSLRGQVHDENAAALGGVAGHAGLFSTASDLARFCQMLLNDGELEGTRVLSPLSVRAMLAPQSTCLGSARGFGFDLHSAYASIRGDLLPSGSAGHSGFTGTSLWIDRDLGLAIILLTNVVHPTRERSARRLRSRVSNVVAAALKPPSATVPDRVRDPLLVRLGVDLLREEGCRRLAGEAVGLITNHTGRCADGTPTLRMLLEHGVKVRALFSPEHGIAGRLDEEVASGRDEETGLPIHSLFGETRSPLPEWLEGLETLVFDIQDIGARFYTYISTMGLCMEAAAKHGLRFVVLDRPNPITGGHVEGPILDLRLRNFAGYYAIPIRHGLTVGELARLINVEIGCHLEVVPVQGWRRSMWWDQTGLEWVNPSPAMRTLNAATLYPGLCCLESANLSMGRGTDTPFEVIGAPWIEPRRLAAELTARDIPGIGFVPVHFTPQLRDYQGERCGGLYCVVTDREAFQPVRMVIHLAELLHRFHTREFTFDRIDTLVGTERVRVLLEQFAPAEAIIAEWEEDEAGFRERRAPFLLYE